MSTLLSWRIWLLALAGGLVLPVVGADPSAAPASAEKTSAAETTDKSAPIHVTPGPYDGQIAFVTAEMLEQMHYLHQPFNEMISSKFLDRYEEALDPQHLYFLQSDIAAFEIYRTNLNHLTIGRKGGADTRPACIIFNRFAERLRQRVDFVDQELKNDKFTFDGDDRILINRKDAPYPKDLDESKNLWRDQLRYQYLQERLAKIAAKKKPEPAATEKKTEGPARTDDEEIVETLTRRYHRLYKTFSEWNNDDVLQAYLNTLAHVYDPHSDYFGHAALDTFSIGMNLSLFGIGAELQQSEDGYCTIKRILPEGPAEKSKQLNVKDRIVAVAQSNQPPVDIVDMNLNKAVQLIRGPRGTEVRLTVMPAGEDSSTRKVVTLLRDEIKLEDQAAKARIIELTNGPQETLRLGVIDLPSFYAPVDLTGNHRAEHADGSGTGTTKSTSGDVAQLIKKLKQENVEGLILDLRRNGGGSLEEAIKLTGLFIKEGPVVQVRDWKGNIQSDSDNDPSILYDGPLIVLTSRFSASASEILAGALQDYGRALIVGDSSTHGKGTVQNVNGLKPYIHYADDASAPDPGALKLTIKKFYRASGASTQLRGVTPDIVLPSPFNESKEIGESSLDNPLPWDTIHSAKFDKVEVVAPYVPDLSQRSAARVATSRDFDYVREDIEQTKKLLADKTVSLNEKQVLKEREEIETRNKARDDERRSRPLPPEKVYEITLKQSFQPGLPAPLNPNDRTNATVTKSSGSEGSLSATVSTNSAAVTNRESPNRPEEPPAVDPTMDEAEHILVDYISVFPKKKRPDGRPIGYYRYELTGTSQGVLAER